MSNQTPYEPASGEYLCTKIYSGDGSTTSFSYSFDYIGKDTWTVNSPNTASTSYNAYLRLLVNDVAVPYTMSNASTLVASTAPASGTDNVRIVRDSSISDRLVDYVEGSVITESNLDKDSKQAVFLIQELHDRALDISDSNESYVNSYYYDNVSGSQTNFVLNLTASGQISEETSLLANNEVLVMLNGTIQQSLTANYAVSMTGSNLQVVFTSAPALGTDVEIRTLASGVSQRVNIGTGDVTTAKLASGAVTWVKTNFDGAGADGTVLTQRSGGATWGSLTAGSISGLGTFVTSYKVTDFTAPTTSLSMNQNKITNVATPSLTSDAANKWYVDNQASSTYSPSYKIASASVDSTGVTITCPFAWTHVRITTDINQTGTLVGTVYNPDTGNPVTTSYAIPNVRIFESGDFPVTWDYRWYQASNKYEISITKSGNDLTFTKAGYQATSGSVSIHVEFIMNSPSI